MNYLHGLILLFFCNQRLHGCFTYSLLRWKVLRKKFDFIKVSIAVKKHFLLLFLLTLRKNLWFCLSFQKKVLLRKFSKNVFFLNMFAVESHNFKGTGKDIKGKPRSQELQWYKRLESFKSCISYFIFWSWSLNNISGICRQDTWQIFFGSFKIKHRASSLSK